MNNRDYCLSGRTAMVGSRAAILLCLCMAGFVGAAEPAKPAPPFATAHDAALDAKEALVTEAADHTQYRVEFTGIKGDRVPAFLYVPKAKEKTATTRYPAIMLQYGTGGNKTTNYIVSIGKQ